MHHFLHGLSYDNFIKGMLREDSWQHLTLPALKAHTLLTRADQRSGFVFGACTSQIQAASLAHAGAAFASKDKHTH